MDFVTGVLEEIATDPAERRVTVRAGGPRFSVFDGYKAGRDGVARLASAEWMCGHECEIVLLATIDVEPSRSGRNEAPFGIAPKDETDYRNVGFTGQFERLFDDASELLGGVHLFGDSEEADNGVPLGETAYEQLPVAVVSTDTGNVLVDVSALSTDSVESLVGERVAVVASRTDLLGLSE